MGITDACTDLAREITRCGFVEVFTHHDADGIAAAAIMATAMFRAGVRFRVRVRQRVTTDDLKTDDPILLTDLGASLPDLPERTMVIDHHKPGFKGVNHVNPRLFGIDGEHELSAAGTAFLVAQGFGDNRDLAGLVLCGIIGDGQHLAGPNREIIHEAMALGVIEPGRGMLLPGRDTLERLYLATNPFLSGVSGNQPAIEDLLGKSQGSDGEDITTLLSLIVLENATSLHPRAMFALFGDTYRLGREVIPDASSLAMVMDACGKTGHGGLALTIGLREMGSVESGWEVTRKHRTDVVQALISLKEHEEGVFPIENPAVASDVADAIAGTWKPDAPVLVYACRDGSCRISVRSPVESSADLGELMDKLGREAGGYGGGHRTRAGATIPADRLNGFTEAFRGAVVV
jgi:nanoRNase/pAp phosphatase (c-di-AMP/oligoRNAs hydrolase)